MGGMLGVLVCLYCRSGCQASVVASSLAFHPPDPYYQLGYDEASQTYSIYFALEVPEVPFDHLNLSVELLETKNKTKVPIVCLRFPGANITIIFSHGNASDCGSMFMMYAMMALTLRVNVVGYDYTGYGASMEHGVPPTEKQTYKDIERVYDWCIESKLVKDAAKELVLYGQSVGSGPSCYLAARRPVAGLVLHSPITSGLRVITDSRLLACFDIFPNISRIKGVKSPVYIMHGKNDAEVPFEHGIQLLGAVPIENRYEPWWVPNRGHNDILAGNEHEYFRRLASFLEHVKKNNQDEGGVLYRLDEDAIHTGLDINKAH